MIVTVVILMDLKGIIAITAALIATISVNAGDSSRYKGYLTVHPCNIVSPQP